jgi:hypothetical protein
MTADDPGRRDMAELARLLPAPAERDLPAGRQHTLKEHLMSELRLAASPPAGRPATRRHRTPAILIAAAGAAALAAAIVLTLLPGNTPGASPAAARLLAKIADAAARQPVPHVRDSQYMYVETVIAYPSPPPPISGPYPRRIHLARITSQVWAPVANVCRTGLERGITANGHVSSAKFSAQGPGMKCPSIGGLNDPTYRLLQTLPTNPHALLALIYRVERGHGPGPAQEAFVTIGDLLRNTIAPPKVTAALYRAAALIPGVTLVPDATDAIGRHGVAIARTGPGVRGGVREELIFSQTTLQLIGERTVIARTGVTTTATAIIARAIVDHAGQIPG